MRYPPGTPSWVELRSPDLDASAHFYKGLLGWDTTAGSGVFTLEGDEVAGLSALEPGARPGWLTHIAVADTATVEERVEAAGGSVVAAGLFSDAEGAVFAASQRGAERVNAPGALSMNELRTRSIDVASSFYGDAFGWTVQPIEQGGATVYGSVQLDGRLVAGMLPMGEAFPPALPAHWVPYFGVEDLEDAAARALELGAHVLAGPIDVPAGRFTALADPHGAALAIWHGTYDDPPG
jgi:predicted enzyme related to lactoylglutathione lyase